MDKRDYFHDADWLSLSKVAGKKIADIIGYVSAEFGRNTLVFKITRIIFEDGTESFVEGEHDIPYIPGDDFDEQLLQELFDE